MVLKSEKIMDGVEIVLEESPKNFIIKIKLLRSSLILHKYKKTKDVAYQNANFDFEKEKERLKKAIEEHKVLDATSAILYFL